MQNSKLNKKNCAKVSSWTSVECRLKTQKEIYKFTTRDFLEIFVFHNELPTVKLLDTNDIFCKA